MHILRLHYPSGKQSKELEVEVEREMAKYDVIIGKIADDATNATLTAYLGSVFGTVGEKIWLK